MRRFFNLKGRFRFQKNIWYIAVGVVIGLASFMFTSYIAQQLAAVEKREVRLWSHAMTMMGSGQSHYGFDSDSDIGRVIIEIISTNTTIPSIVTNDRYVVKEYTNISKDIVESPERLRRELEKMASLGNIIEINLFNRGTYYVFYNESHILQMLRFYPYVQLSIIAIFIMFAFITFKSSKQDEQKRVWIGMAKETAHQLGTPTSSLLGWLEYLRSQEVEPFVIDEMNKDITRLLKVVDRFSKIGSQTVLAPKNIVVLIESVVTYFQTRIPKNVELKYNAMSDIPLQAAVNDALFEWVIENLLKNALDALSGKGSIVVSVREEFGWIKIDVTDSGKGMPKSNFEKIFSPGFTTKTRGWGLGLSLSKRIVEDSHGGRIFVSRSEIGLGTTMSVRLKKL